MTTTSAKQSDTMQDMLCSLSGNWWLFVLRGVLALVIAVLAFLMPAESLLALTLVFGAFAFADGVFGLVAAVRNIRARRAGEGDSGDRLPRGRGRHRRPPATAHLPRREGLRPGAADQAGCLA